MKTKIAFVLCCGLAAFTACAAFLTPVQMAALNRRRAVRRERIEVNGEPFLVTTFMRGAKFDGTTTNRLQNIVGVEQNNPLQNRIEELMERIRENEEVIARIRASAVEKKAKYAGLEKKAVTNTMRTIYAELVEANQEIIDWCDGKAVE